MDEQYVGSHYSKNVRKRRKGKEKQNRGRRPKIMKSEIIQLLRKHKVLNSHQMCRLLNGYSKDEFKQCYYTFKEKPMGTKNLACRNHGLKKEGLCPKCKVTQGQVYYHLSKMRAPIQSYKLRFFDHGGIGSDLFRFWFMEKEEFHNRILRQTLIPYVTN